MTDQVLPKKLTVDESTNTDVISIPSSSVNVDQLTQTLQTNRVKEEVRNLTATKAYESKITEFDKKGLSLSSPSHLNDEMSQRHTVPFASHQKKTSKSKNEKLPQTGNHAGHLVVACGVTLLSVLGLFKTGKRH